MSTKYTDLFNIAEGAVEFDDITTNRFIFRLVSGTRYSSTAYMRDDKGYFPFITNASGPLRGFIISVSDKSKLSPAATMVAGFGEEELYFVKFDKLNQFFSHILEGVAPIAPSFIKLSDERDWANELNKLDPDPYSVAEVLAEAFAVYMEMVALARSRVGEIGTLLSRSRLRTAFYHSIRTDLDGFDKLDPSTIVSSEDDDEGRLGLLADTAFDKFNLVVELNQNASTSEAVHLSMGKESTIRKFFTVTVPECIREGDLDAWYEARSDFIHSITDSSISAANSVVFMIIGRLAFENNGLQSHHTMGSYTTSFETIDRSGDFVKHITGLYTPEPRGQFGQSPIYPNGGQLHPSNIQSYPNGIGAWGSHNPQYCPNGIYPQPIGQHGVPPPVHQTGTFTTTGQIFQEFARPEANDVRTRTGNTTKSKSRNRGSR